MDDMESDEDSNLSALFQDSDNSSVKIEREIWGAPQLATQDTDVIINQLKLNQQRTTLVCTRAITKGTPWQLYDKDMIWRH